MGHYLVRTEVGSKYMLIQVHKKAQWCKLKCIEQYKYISTIVHTSNLSYTPSKLMWHHVIHSRFAIQQGGLTALRGMSMSCITEACAESTIGHSCWFGLNLVQKSDFCLVDSKFRFSGSLWPLAAQILISHPQIHQIGCTVYRNFFDVTAVNGEYRNAKSTKRVTVTGSYSID